MQRRPRSRGRDSLQQQIDRLTTTINQLTASGSRRRRSRSRPRSRTPTNVAQAPAASSIVVPRGSGRRQRQQGPQRGFAQSGTLRFSNRELFTTISMPKSKTEVSGAFEISGKDQVGFLAKLAALFGRMRWIDVSFEYESMVGANTSGVLAYGVDWGCSVPATGKPPTFAQVTALNPSISHPLWESRCRLPPFPRQRLNARQWYDIDSGDIEVRALATLHYYLSAASSDSDMNVGALWINYLVEFQGPHM